jgi:hypothetical protein
VFDIVAILGRGIQRSSPGSGWVLTEDLEVCDERSAHLPVRVPADDENPYCMVGGGTMNLLAGSILIRQNKPLITVCAFGDRSEYLKSVDGPTESEVMSRSLNKAILTAVVTWPRTRSAPGASNTRQELLNIFDLALKNDLKQIGIVTVGVHVPRTATYIAKHLSIHERYRQLAPTVLESEEILLAADRQQYGPRVEALRNSKAFARNWEREAIGISKIVRDVYGDAVKPLVVT